MFFLFDSEPIHEFFLDLGWIMGRVPGVAEIMRMLYRVRHPSLRTTVAGIDFENPIGLAAGFDYTAKLPRILPGLGFGFGSVGTLTFRPYGGNPYPRLKRLPKSRSLLVNKGFKNLGVATTLEKHKKSVFGVPVGVSIGRTNTLDHKMIEDAIADVCDGFRDAEASGVQFAYYELNISCPNLLSAIEFYSTDSLRKLLTAVTALRLSRPIFIKMPIDRTGDELRDMLDVIMEFPIAGVIIGNLQKDRTDPAFEKDELAQFFDKKGNFGGKPCFLRSNELIRIAFAHVGRRLPIIGCGGIFSAEDAYAKIRAGASLVQIASGVVFMGPLLPAEISADLPGLIARDGFSSVADAVGVGGS